MTLTKAQSVESVGKLLSIAKSTMATGKNVLLSGFGKFNIKDKNLVAAKFPNGGRVEAWIAPSGDVQTIKHPQTTSQLGMSLLNFRHR